jgi:hypothetical protein
LIECEELRDVVLCGHSAGAHTATGVADALPDRISHFVSVDGLQPAPGELVNAVLGEEHGVPDLFRKLAREHDGVMIPPAVFSAADFGVTDSADAAWVMRRMTPHPLRCFEEPVAVGAGFDSVASKTFVRCEQFPGPYAIRLIDALEQDPDWVTHRWDVGHGCPRGRWGAPHTVVARTARLRHAPSRTRDVLRPALGRYESNARIPRLRYHTSAFARPLGVGGTRLLPRRHGYVTRRHAYGTF